ncbi:MAG: hypothetical protein KAU48_11370, partial [Candidatus Thorarchaeota archaeon]|nr:hypothetical protein [Candidatus Thorarchaeota archaeon]
MTLVVRIISLFVHELCGNICHLASNLGSYWSKSLGFLYVHTDNIMKTPRLEIILMDAAKNTLEFGK